MEKVEQYSSVMIRPGTYPAFGVATLTFPDETRGAVVEIYGEQETFLVDVGSSPIDWNTIEVHREDIVKIIRD